MAATHSRYRRRPQSRSVGRRALCRRRQHRALPDAHVRQRRDLRRRRRPRPRARSPRAARTYFDPYHAALAAEIARVRARHGYAILLDGHSIRAQVPRFFAGRLPDLNLGTADGASCAPGLAGAPPRACSRGAGLHARRQRPLQGRLRDAPLRAAGATACMRCSSRWRRRATWTKRRRIAGTPARAAPLAACSSASSLR